MLARPNELDHIAALSEEAYLLGLSGDFSRNAALCSRLSEHSNPRFQAWALALTGQRAHAEPDVASVPSLHACEAYVDADADVRAIAVLAVAQTAKWAVIVHDTTALTKCVELQHRLATGLDDARALAHVELYQAWLALAEGRATDAASLAESCAGRASKQTLANVLIDATVVRALAVAELEDLAEATSSARSASRMARAEDFPQAQYLSGVALARIRRLNGSPHLATRILRPMPGVLPAHWLGWFGWEALMAGATSLASSVVLSDVNDPQSMVRSFSAVIAGAQAGDRAVLNRSRAALGRAHPVWQSRARDSMMALTVLDPSSPLESIDDAVKQWVVGKRPTPPNAVKGFCVGVETDDAEPGPAAYVVAGPPGDTGLPTARRVACLGEPLLGGIARVEQVKGKFERTVTAVAAIALAGAEGLDKAELFQDVYGFAYNSELHRTALNTLRHRVKRTIDTHGSLRFEEGRHAFELRHPVVIPDPRCGQSLEESVLRVFARLGAVGAKHASENLGVPLRTLQKSIKLLVEDGALSIEREGREVRYKVEDTTFSEPTKWSAQLPDVSVKS